MRIRATAVVIDGGDVLLIDRVKDGRTYSALPGGGLESGETLQQACLRELREETGLDGTFRDLLPVPVDPEAPVFYLAVTMTMRSRELRLGEPEASRSSPENLYLPRWVPLAELDRRDILAPARQAIVAAIRSGR